MENVETLGVFSVQFTEDIKKEITLLKIPVSRSEQLRADLRQHNYRPSRNGFASLRALLADDEFRRIAGVHEKTRIELNTERPGADLFFVFVHHEDPEDSYLFLDVENYSRGTHYRPVGMLVEKHHEE